MFPIKILRLLRHRTRVSQAALPPLSAASASAVRIFEHRGQSREISARLTSDCNGNAQGTIIREYSERMYEVRLMDGCRHVGDVVVSQRDLDIYNPSDTAAEPTVRP